MAPVLREDVTISGEILELERRSGPRPGPEAVDALGPGQPGERQDDGGGHEANEARRAGHAGPRPEADVTSDPEAAQAVISRAVIVYLKFSGS